MGQDVSVLSDASDDHVLNIVQHINNKAEEIRRASKNLPMLNVSLLVALNLADELFRLRGEKETIYSQLETRSEELIHIIDRKGKEENIPLRCA
jgi:cell division protein ZapA (FtsZ GTPase activity inhibitor)